jgi:hypothetical protein
MLLSMYADDGCHTAADDIIRQHKAACLRITALLVCKDLLWVGTSAGVILTIPIPKITSTTSHGSLVTPAVTGNTGLFPMFFNSE